MTIRKRTDRWLIFGRTARIISIFGKGKHCCTSVTNWDICNILKKRIIQKPPTFLFPPVEESIYRLTHLANDYRDLTEKL